MKLLITFLSVLFLTLTISFTSYADEGNEGGGGTLGEEGSSNRNSTGYFLNSDKPEISAQSAQSFSSYGQQLVKCQEFGEKDLSFSIYRLENGEFEKVNYKGNQISSVEQRLIYLKTYAVHTFTMSVNANTMEIVIDAQSESELFNGYVSFHNKDYSVYTKTIIQCELVALNN